MEPKVKDMEVQYIIQTIQSASNGYNPKVLFCLVNKRITHRLFEQINGTYINPGPGTVLDT